jgi:hypothetical protein
MKTKGGMHKSSAGAIPYLWKRLPLFAIRVAKNGIVLTGTPAIITLGEVRLPVPKECTWLEIIISHMMVVIAAAARA